MDRIYTQLAFTLNPIVLTPHSLVVLSNMGSQLGRCDDNTAANLQQLALPTITQHPLTFTPGSVGEVSCPGAQRQTRMKRDLHHQPTLPSEKQSW